MKPRKSFVLAALTAFIAGGASASALPPLGRQAMGAVRAVDRAAQTLSIASAAEPQPRVFHWNERTRFFAGRRAITAAAIPLRATVSFIYHTPFIGDPFVTKVTVLHPLPARPQTPSKSSLAMPVVPKSQIPPL